MRVPLPPGPPRLLVIGDVFEDESEGLPGVLRRAHQEYGPIFTMRVATIPVVTMVGPAANRYVLVQAAHNFEAGANPIAKVLGEGLLVLDGADHQAHRALLAPALHKQRVEAHVSTMLSYAQRTIGMWQPGTVIHVLEEARAMTLAMTAGVVLGIDLTAAYAGLKPCLADIVGFFDHPATLAFLPLDLPFGRWRRLRQARQRFDMILRAAIQRREAAGGEGPDVVSALVHAQDDRGQRLTDQQIADEVAMLVLAGHDTIAAPIAWAVMLLCQHPAVLATVRAEQQSVLDGRRPTVDDFRRMRYLDMVVREVLRLYPPGWITMRRAKAAFAWGSARVPAGTLVAISPWLTHRHPDSFAQPDAFRPERFDKQHGERHPPYTYLPFGGGGRACLGMHLGMLEAKVILWALLQQWTFTAIPGHVVTTRIWPLLQPANDVRITVSPAST